LGRREKEIHHKKEKATRDKHKDKTHIKKANKKYLRRYTTH